MKEMTRSSGTLYRKLMTGLVVLSVFLANKVLSQQEGSALTNGSLLNAVSEITDSVRVGEPFSYVIRVDYRPDQVRPDFRRLLRDVVLHPFEQIHKTRTLISDLELEGGIRRYQLSYSIVAVNVVPGESYPIEPLYVHYHLPGSDEDLQIEIGEKSIKIDKYLIDDFLTVQFQPLKANVPDSSGIKRISLILGILTFIAAGIVLIRKAIIKPTVTGKTFSDLSQEKFKNVRESNISKRQKIIQYEYLILSLLKHYLNLGARFFWSASKTGSEEEVLKREKIKLHLQSGYRAGDPGENDIEVIEGGLVSLYSGIEQQAESERFEDMLVRQGTVHQRISRNKFTFYSGILLILMSLIFIFILLNPQLWIDRDARAFNNWIDSLPDRLLKEDNEEELDILDVQVLGNISEQQRVLENLESDKLRSAYLYNYGTVVAKVFRKLLTMPPEDEEDEATEPPSFEFPLQLLSNAVRFYPYDEDIRRNLEIVILLRENEEEKGTDEIQGELGPPTPGFSRDMNQVLF